MLTEDPQIKLEFVPTVPESLRPEVEQLFFFNSRQSLLIDKIRAAVHQHGIPQILVEEGKLRISVPENDMQCLFALDRSTEARQLAAVVMYLRATPECLSITHLAVHEDYAHGNGADHTGVGVRVIDAVRRIARRIKGVSRIELPYKPGCYLRV